MAHNLATGKDGKPAMMFTGETPWHGLGTKLENPATAAEAIKAAGLDWKVVMQDIRRGDKPVDGYKAVVREDTDAVLSVMKDSYTPIQNQAAFEGIDKLVGSKQAIYHTAGALGKGEKVWMMAKLPGDVVVKGTDGDKIEKFLLLSNSHDGSQALRIFFTPVRVVCQNTLNAALGKAGREGVAIRHTVNAESRFEEARKILGISLKFYDDFEARVNRFREVKMNAKLLEAYINEVMPVKEDAKRKTRALNNRGEIERLFTEGKGQDIAGVKGTLWAALNSVTEFASYYKGTRGSNDDERKSNRLESVWFGSAAELNRRAWSAAEAFAGIV